MTPDDQLLEDAFKTKTGSQLLMKFQELQQAVTKEQEARRMLDARADAVISAQARRRSPEMIIIAGNDGQAEMHCKALGIHPFDAVIAKSVDRVRGLTSFDVVLVGTWYRRPDLDELFGVITASVMTRKLQGDDMGEAGNTDPSQAYNGVNVLGHAAQKPLPPLASPSAAATISAGLIAHTKSLLPRP